MSDPLEELKKISAAERAETQSEIDEKARDERKERENERRKLEARARSGKRAPGFFSTTRFFIVAMVGLAFGTIVASAWFENDTWWQSPVVAGLAAAWLAVVLVLLIDSLTWRARLPFKVVGMETINGQDKSDDGNMPYIAFDIRIQFSSAGDDQARDKTLEILAERANRELKKNSDLNFTKERVWRVREGRVNGEGSRILYTQRMIETWLRREVRLLHRAVPVGEVTVNATYTGDSFHVSSSD